MSWFTIIFILCFTFIDPSVADHGKKVPSSSPSAVVIGTVFCDTCFQEDFSKTSHFISGTSVVVECGDGSLKPSFQKEAKTNEHGVFKVHLPISVSKHVRKIKRCSVRLISSSEPYCSVASTATSSSLRLKSRKQGIHIFSAGFFSFKPLKQPYLCNQKPSVGNSKQLGSIKSLYPPNDPIQFPPPIQTPDLPPTNQYYFPPLPLLPTLPPLPQLPPLPPLPGLPKFPPKPQSKLPQSSMNAPQLLNQKPAHPEFFFPPLIPSPPPASIVPLPPNPFQPPPLLPPNPFQSPPPFINLPPIPGLTPSPPPQAFPFPLPPFPFPPPHRFPRIPPASSSTNKGSP